MDINNLIKKSSVLIISIFFTASIYSASKNTIVVKVLGMVCSFCATSIEKTFSKESAVKSVKVNLDTKTVTINLKPNTQISKNKTNDINYNR